MANQPEIQSKLIPMGIDSGKVFEKAFFTENSAIFMNIDMFEFAAHIEKWVVEHMYIVPQRIVNQYNVIYMKKNFFLKDAFDTQIKEFSAFGFFVKWENLFLYKKDINRDILDDGVRAQVILYDLTALFKIWSWCLLIALGGFVGEIFWYKLRALF